MIGLLRLTLARRDSAEADDPEDSPADTDS
jgi:hypothetical protein